MNREEVLKIREDFPYLNMDKNIIYLDNGATTQKPIQVIEALEHYYKFQNGNPHRGAHYLAMASTEAYEGARDYIAKFLGASSDEVVFVRNATEGLNLLAYSYGMEEIKEGDEILISIMEHHSNHVTWQEVAKRKNAKLEHLYLDDDMQIPWEEFTSKINENTKIFSITAASNVVGTMPDLPKMISYIRENYKDVKIFVDAAQYLPHQKVNVKELDCDALVFSGHKMVSPMGIGVLYGKRDFLNSLKPFMYGGDMIEYVYEDKSTYLNSPQRFEAGTQNVGGAVSLRYAIEYLENIGFDKIFEYEKSLTKYCYDKLKKSDYIEVYTTSNEHRSPVISFNFKDAHPHDVASIVDTKGVAIRSGHHCAQPLHRKLGCNFSCRASFAFYNTFEEVDKFIESLEYVKEVMGIES